MALCAKTDKMENIEAGGQSLHQLKQTTDTRSPLLSLGLYFLVIALFLSLVIKSETLGAHRQKILKLGSRRTLATLRADVNVTLSLMIRLRLQLLLQRRIRLLDSSIHPRALLSSAVSFQGKTPDLRGCSYPISSASRIARFPFLPFAVPSSFGVRVRA